MQSPKVTILLSSYNHAPYLREAIDSALNQTFSDFELIILDDGSTDDSWTIIQSYEDSRIRAFRNASPLGPAINANRALTELARGEYIAIHHSDDVWAADKLDHQCAALDADSSLGAIFTWVQVIDESSQPQDNDWFNQPPASRWTLLRKLFNEENRLAHPSALVRRACYTQSGLYHPGLVQTPDADMWCRLLIDWPVQILSSRLTLHRIHTNRSNTSSSHRPEVHFRTANEWNHLRRHLLRLPDADRMLQVFPELEALCPDARRGQVDFLLALACLYCSEKRSAWGLGFELLFGMLNDDKVRRSLEETHGFDWSALAKLTGSHDVYGSNDLQQLALTDEACRRLSMELELARGSLLSLKNELASAEARTADTTTLLIDTQEMLADCRLTASELSDELATARAEIATLTTQRDHLQLRLDRITGNSVYRTLAAVYRMFKNDNA